MRRSRVQFTVRRMMITIALVSLLLGIFLHRERRIRRLDRLVTDQENFVLSAEANVGNAVLAREAAEHSLGQYTENDYGPRAETLRNEAAHAPAIADQLHPSANDKMELSNAEKLFARIIQQLHEGHFAAGLDAPTAALSVIKQIQALENRLAATRARQVAGAQGPLEKTRINMDIEIERARGEERIKKMILVYERAFLESLKRERANVWW
jgi:hypothetical protein